MAQPNPHRLSQRVCYRSLVSTDAAFALPAAAVAWAADIAALGIDSEKRCQRRRLSRHA
jgi:hypothetical protein